jgi:hypothetical protein
MHFMEIASVRARTADANTSARLAQMRRIWTPTGAMRRARLRATPWLITAVFGLIGIPLSFALGSRNICFTDKEIVFRPFMLLPVSKYQMGQIESVEASCNASTKSGWGISIAIRTNDGMEFPISAVGIWQIAPLPRIMRLLHDAPFDDSRMLPGCPRNLRARLIPD